MVEEHALTGIVAEPHETKTAVETVEEIVGGKSIVLVCASDAWPLVAIVEAETRAVGQASERGAEVERRLVAL